MKIKQLFLSLLALIPLWGCSNKEYDPFGKLNKEIVLFHDGITLPVGNVGPVTVDAILGNGNIRELLNQFVKVESDGRLYLEASDEFFNKNAFEIALNSPDNTQPYHWEIGDLSASVGSLGSVLGMFGFSFPHQMLILQTENPLYAGITLNATARIGCIASNYSESYSKEEQLIDYAIPSSYATRTIVQFEVPEDVVDRVAKVELKGVTLDLPENLPDKIHSGSASFFKFAYKYKSFFAMGEKFSMTQSLPVSGLNVPLGQFGLQECQLSFDLVNSLPVDVTLDSVGIMDASGGVNPNIKVSSGVHIAGGSIESPVTTPVTLSVKSSNGPIPDITGVEVTVSLKAPDGLANVPLSTKMSLSVKSASVTVRGGITVPSHVL